MNRQPRPSSLKPSRGQAKGSADGFSLIELCVATAVLMIFVGIASESLIHSYRLTAVVQRGLTSSSPALVRAFLLRDVRQASGIERGVLVWSGRPLVLQLPTGERIRYRLAKGTLERQVFSATGQPQAPGRITPNVATWRWRQSSPGVLDVGFEFRSAPTPATDHLVPWRLKPRATTLRLMLRGRSRGSW